MKLHSSVWEDTEAVLAYTPDGLRMRVAGISRAVAWITWAWTSPVEPDDPTSPASLRAAAEQGLDQINDRRLVVMVRPMPGEALGTMEFVLDPDGMPQRVPGHWPLSKDDLEAHASLLKMIANLPGRWPEVAAELEQCRVKLGLPPLDQVWS